MNKEEFGRFAMAMRTFYSKEDILPNKQALELWYRELQDIPYQVAELALRKWVAINKWSPSIAEIREMSVNVSEGDSLTWGESWERVLTSIRKYGMYRQEEALDSLDPLTRKCVQNIGFRQLCTSENPMQDRANYRMIFEIMAKREQTDKQLALPLQRDISMLQLQQAENGFYRLGGGE